MSSSRFEAFRLLKTMLQFPAEFKLVQAENLVAHASYKYVFGKTIMEMVKKVLPVKSKESLVDEILRDLEKVEHGVQQLLEIYRKEQQSAEKGDDDDEKEEGN
ncbi:unnamed protein product [Cuscuta epithymum]|uniref:Uncharacterized protein n=1 Tax=Cuscuta epithymum TaxID=186058 RepID=A0AAV0EGE3_9ASTE|nr:unnamed protein product [Cuscuta epithymum]